MAVSRLSYKIQDIEGKSKTVVIHFPLSATAADIAAFASSQAPFLDALTSGEIVEISLTQSLAIPAGLKASPAGSSRVSSGALLSYLNSANVPYSIFIPASVDSLTDGGIVVEAQVNSFNSGFLAGGGTADPCDLNQLDIVSYVGGYLTSRK